jgi:hypothetical protein
MKKSLALFLQIVTVVIGIGVLIFMFWEPTREGRNIGATFIQVYFHDFFLAYAYTASIAFFVAVFQAFKFFGNMGRNEKASRDSVKALRTIRACMLIIIAFVLGAEGFLMIARPGDDIAGGVAMGLFVIILSTAVATVVSISGKKLQKAIDTTA